MISYPDLTVPFQASLWQFISTLKVYILWCFQLHQTGFSWLASSISRMFFNTETVVPKLLVFILMSTYVTNPMFWSGLCAREASDQPGHNFSFLY